MNTLGRGAIAGLAATVVLSMIMIAKMMMGLMPELNVIQMLSGMLGTSAAVAWLVHFAVGIVWGVLFALVYGALPGGNGIVKGIVFGLLGWLAMMLFVMPMAGAGLFGMNLGIMAPVMTAILHVVFGAVMGFAYEKLASANNPRDSASRGYA